MLNLLGYGRWETHPWNDYGLVKLFPTEFLKKYSNKTPSKYTNMSSGEIVKQEKVWADILENGMDEPMQLIIGTKDKTLRLESGNHRINMALKHGITHLPTVVFVSHDSIINSGNGEHYFNAEDVVNFSGLIKCYYYYQINPELYFKDMKDGILSN